MNKFFLECIKRVGFNESVSQMGYFRELPNNLVRLIMSLSKENFINYISFIVKLRRNGLLTGNEDKLIRISNLFVLNMNNYNARALMVLISNTRLLEHKQVINFSTLLLQLTNEEQVYAIYELISNLNNLNNTNIVNLVQMVKRTKNKLQLDELIKLLLRSDIRKHKYFINFTEMILRNSSNLNYLYINNCLNQEELLNHKDILLLLNKYLMTSKTREEADLIYRIITNKSMLKSSYLYKLLDTLKDDYSLNYLQEIKKIVLLKDKISDSSFDILLTTLFKTKNNLQKKGVLQVLNYSKLFDNTIQLSYILNKCLKIDKNYQLECLKISLEKIVIKDNFDFYKENNMSIIDTIIPNGKNNDEIEDYQALCLANSFEYLIDSKYRNILINDIKNANKAVCHYITILLGINGIQELNCFTKIIDEMFKVKTENKLKAITSLLMQDNIIKSSNYLKVIYLINKTDEFILEDTLKVISKLPNIDDKNIIMLLDKLSNEKDYNRHNVLVEIISNYQVLGYDKTLNYINLLEGKDKKGCKEILKELKEELNKINDLDSNKDRYKILK